MSDNKQFLACEDHRKSFFYTNLRSGQEEDELNYGRETPNSQSPFTPSPPPPLRPLMVAMIAYAVTEDYSLSSRGKKYVEQMSRWVRKHRQKSHHSIHFEKREHKFWRDVGRAGVGNFITDGISFATGFVDMFALRPAHLHVQHIQMQS